MRPTRGIALIAALLPLACGSKEEKAPPPAKVEGAKPESQLATVTLTPEAEQRLGLTFAPVGRHPVVAFPSRLRCREPCSSRRTASSRPRARA
jgi:hypothetical protein